MSSPFLRPAAPVPGRAPVPAGWSVERAGLWDGRPAEVVFDPRRHDVALFLGPTSPQTRADLRAAGWLRQGAGPTGELWSRDRTTAARQRLARTTGPATGLSIA